MKKVTQGVNKNKKINFKLLTIIGIVCVIVIISIILVSILVRKNNINKQAIKYIDNEYNTTTIFCNGKNIKLNDTVYNKIKEESLDLIIYNDKYIAKIKNECVDKDIDVNIEILTNKNYEDGYDVKINTNGIIELKVNVKNSKNIKEYISQFVNNELITNEAIVTPEGFTEVELVDEAKEYVLAYLIPEDFELEDITINKGTSKVLDIKLDKRNYTYGSLNIECENKDAIDIDGFKVTAKEVGEYKIKAKTGKVEQSVEKIELSNLTLEMIKDTDTTVSAIVVPENAVYKELEWKSSDVNIATVDNNGNIRAVNQGNCEIIVSTKEEPIVFAKMQVEVKNKINSVSQIYGPSLGQVEGITYINGIMLVNKTHSIPANYAPGLQSIAYNAFLDLRRDAATAGFDIQLLSGFRSYETQKKLYNNYVATYGQEEADTFSAKPGTSEHQTGLAMDVGWIDDSYGDTPSGQWLAANCYKYGFIIRYPKSKENITGYKYEPWHIRYLGSDIAKKVYDSGLCLEEYLGVTD